MTLIAKDYWEQRYADGGNSGSGSQGDLAQAKADHINTVLRRDDVTSVVDWGCGDGTLLSLLDLDTVRYVGVDVSASAIQLSAQKRPEVALVLWREGADIYFSADLALSIDILFHFPDDDEYDKYLAALFRSSRRYVLIHNAEHGPDPHEHVRWRPVSSDVRQRFPNWDMARVTPGVNDCEFILYKRVDLENAHR